MKAMTYVAAGALALVPMLALAGEQTAKPDMQPLRVSFDGRTVPVKATTTVDYTAAGPVKVRTWAWNDPKDGASFEIQTSGWHETPSAALKQISAADADLQNWQAQMASVQRQMLQLGSLAPASLAGDGYAPRHAGRTRAGDVVRAGLDAARADHRDLFDAPCHGADPIVTMAR
ncbi:hypothetical protein [Burkholderia glumae]|uniref:hypothetical protein n=1 Tax=Burkholderia glumae TaxID=337 RepID=UPI0020D14F1C|nr:hypothetical protein [Burkholderia glumae]